LHQVLREAVQPSVNVVDESEVIEFDGARIRIPEVEVANQHSDCELHMVLEGYVNFTDGDQDGCPEITGEVMGGARTNHSGDGGEQLLGANTLSAAVKIGVGNKTVAWCKDMSVTKSDWSGMLASDMTGHVVSPGMKVELASAVIVDADHEMVHIRDVRKIGDLFSKGEQVASEQPGVGARQSD